MTLGRKGITLDQHWLNVWHLRCNIRGEIGFQKLQNFL